MNNLRRACKEYKLLLFFYHCFYGLIEDLLYFPFKFILYINAAYLRICIKYESLNSPKGLKYLKNLIFRLIEVMSDHYLYKEVMLCQRY